ncbi:ABC transporter permease [Pseudodesulfovibrio indicus]|uniref:ABC transporter permease n=1 Tax=Pseudodesulfovibrio indicus TaxID=1716143 RepID=UPI00292E63A3|nr:ABC transporter permease [Pseudodesulfovibrio indicus]
MSDKIKVALDFKQALLVQARVVYALMLRETKTVFGRSKFGYMWVVIQTAFNVIVIWVIRGVIRSGTVPGLPLPVFLICGFTCWRIFSDTISKVMVSVDANRSLLYFSKVRHFDLGLARALLIAATNIVVMILLLLLVYLLGFKFVLGNMWPLLYSLTMLLAMGLGLGYFCCAIKRYTDSVSVLVSMLLRIGIFVSGVMFSLGHLPPSFHFLIEWNPILQLVEYSRSSFAYAYPGASYMKLGLVSFVSLAILAIGMVMEKVTRTKTDAI